VAGTGTGPRSCSSTGIPAPAVNTHLPAQQHRRALASPMRLHLASKYVLPDIPCNTHAVMHVCPNIHIRCALAPIYAGAAADTRRQSPYTCTVMPALVHALQL